MLQIEMIGVRNSLTGRAGCIMDDDESKAVSMQSPCVDALIGPRPMCSQKPV